MDSAIIWNTNTKNIHKYIKNVQTGCTGYLHGSNTNGRKINNNLLIISRAPDCE